MLSHGRETNNLRGRTPLLKSASDCARVPINSRQPFLANSVLLVLAKLSSEDEAEARVTPFVSSISWQ
jgi:hypothetical protein